MITTTRASARSTGPEHPDERRPEHARRVRKCSCSSLVLVQETAEQVTSVYPLQPILGEDPEAGGGIRRLQRERPVPAALVVMLDVDAEDLVQVPSPDDQQPVQALSADGPNPALGVGVRVGRLHGRQQDLRAF